MKTTAASLVGALALSATTALAAIAPMKRASGITPITVKGNGMSYLPKPF